MFYREAGQFKATYPADMAIFPILQDRWGLAITLAVAIVGVPLFFSDYVIGAFLIPVLIWSLAAMGLNILTGYAGQLSLGHGAFMAVGAYASYNLAVRLPEIPILVVFVLAGLIAAAFGVLVGLPSLRVKGFYLAVATLAAQFFVEWVFGNFKWFTGEDKASMVVDTPPMEILGYRLADTLDNYYLVLGFVIVMTLMAKNLVRSELGRAWMAIRDMDVAAEVIGIRPPQTKLLAFAVSSFYAGVAGALYAFAFVKSVDFTAFDLLRSFQILFMVIIGGLGSILGSFLGAAFIILGPILLNLGFAQFHVNVPPALITNTENMLFGGLIILFLIIEPFGLARLWVTAKEKLRLWPFPH